jgi:hypothetical protein
MRGVELHLDGGGLMYPTVPGVCLFCLMGAPHPLDLPELFLHEASPPNEPVDQE